MAEDLWKLRKRRGMTIKQLAAKSGISAATLEGYERGQPIRVADLNRLARVFFVDAFDIKVQSNPKPAPKPKPKPKAAKPSPPTKTKKPPKPAPARPSQLAHLLGLARKLGEEETAVIKAIGKPLAELSQAEASKWLTKYTEAVKKRTAEKAALRPPDTRRKRAHLPEGVDEFELAYLTARQEAGEWLAFTLFDGQVFNGRIIGFSPYNITIQQADGAKVTLQKLALAYYSVEGKEEAA